MAENVENIVPNLNIEEQIKKINNEKEDDYVYCKHTDYSLHAGLVKAIGIVLIFMVVVLIGVVVFLTFLTNKIISFDYKSSSEETSSPESSYVEYVEDTSSSSSEVVE